MPLSVVIRVDSRTIRRQFHERELVLETYGKEIRALPHVVIDERVGIGLLLQLADLVIAPFAGTTTERAALCRKRRPLSASPWAKKDGRANFSIGNPCRKKFRNFFGLGK